MYTEEMIEASMRVNEQLQALINKAWDTTWNEDDYADMQPEQREHIRVQEFKRLFIEINQEHGARIREAEGFERIDNASGWKFVGK